MKRLTILLLASVVVVFAVSGAQLNYINNGSFSSPPQPIPVINATNFQNNGLFYIYYVSDYIGGTTPNTGLDIAQFDSLGNIDPFDFSDTLNFTNRTTMEGYPGFRFDTSPTTVGSRRWASNFVNAGSSVSTSTNASIHGEWFLQVQATNIVSPGRLQAGAYGLISLKGKSIDLTRGASQIMGFHDNDGIVVRDWSLVNLGKSFLPSVLLTPLAPFSPQYRATNYSLLNTSGYTSFNGQLLLASSTNRQLIVTSPNPLNLNVTNRTTQTIFVQNSNPAIPVSIAFAGAHNGADFDVPIVQWQSVATNAFGVRITNFLYITDTFTTRTNNDVLIKHLYDYGGLPPAHPVYQNTNYLIGRSDLMSASALFTSVGAPYTTAAIFNGTNLPTIISNYQSAAFGFNLTNITAVQPRDINSMMGRMDITAEGPGSSLTLNQTRIQSLNYLNISATNHFINGSNTVIYAPYCDLALGSTNGNLTIAGLFAPFVPGIFGSIDVFTMTWNNVVSNAPLGAPQDTNSVTVPFYTFMVSASLTNQIAPQIFNMSLRSTNVVLGTTNVLPTDVFNVVSNLFIDADNLTLLPSSYLYLTTVGNTWQDYAPYLKNFTNNGVLDDQKSINLTFISHNRATGVEQPYKSFVNTNRILCPGGDTIWSDYVENTGQINPTNGSVIIQSTTALLRSPGVITASNADISIITGTLNVTNHIVRAGRSISLSVTNALNAGTNVWSCGDGFNWFTTTAPGFTGDMLLTTITNNAFAYANVYNYWNAQDRGASAAGYTNNAALGKLVLVGGLNSAFTFAPVDGNNALYVDILDLRGTAGDTNASGAFVNLFVLPSMKVYFSRLQINGVSNNVALLSGQGQGGGLFTSVAHTPSLSSVGGSGGSASFANFNLVAELADASGPKLNANGSAPSTVLVSWDTVANANNTVYYKDSLADSDWHVLTNFVSTTAGRIVMGNANNTGTRFFRVQVDAPTP